MISISLLELLSMGSNIFRIWNGTSSRKISWSARGIHQVSIIYFWLKAMKKQKQLWNKRLRLSQELLRISMLWRLLWWCAANCKYIKKDQRFKKLSICLNTAQRTPSYKDQGRKVRRANDWLNQQNKILESWNSQLFSIINKVRLRLRLSVWKRSIDKQSRKYENHTKNYCVNCFHWTMKI